MSLQAEQIERIDANMDETLHHVDQGHSQLVKVLSCPLRFSHAPPPPAYMMILPWFVVGLIEFSVLFTPRNAAQPWHLVSRFSPPKPPSIGSITTP